MSGMTGCGWLGSGVYRFMGPGMRGLGVMVRCAIGLRSLSGFRPLIAYDNGRILDRVYR